MTQRRRVGPELIEGLPHLQYLSDMMRRVLEGESLDLAPTPYFEHYGKRVDNRYLGWSFYGGRNQCTLGIFFSTPTELYFEVSDPGHVFSLSDEWEHTEGPWRGRTLTLSNDLFSGTVSVQERMIRDFVRMCVNELERADLRTG